MALRNIHSAMGSLAYAIAKADGVIQDEEKKIIQKLAQQEFELSEADNEWIAKMFSQLETDNISLEDAYRFALDTLEANRGEYDFTEGLKQKCVSFMEKVSLAFEGISNEEQVVIERFKKDMIKL